MFECVRICADILYINVKKGKEKRILFFLFFVVVVKMISGIILADSVDRAKDERQLP